VTSDKNFDWQPFVTYHHSRSQPLSYPPRNGRSVCQYVADEPLEIGMRVYVDVALSKWYGGLRRYHEMSQQQLLKDGIQRTMFVCFEDFTDPLQQQQIYDRTMSFLFPTRASDDGVTSRNNETLSHFKIPEPTPFEGAYYSEGHSVNRDPKERAQLRNLVERLDRDFFNNDVSKLDALFGCCTKQVRAS